MAQGLLLLFFKSWFMGLKLVGVNLLTNNFHLEKVFLYMIFFINLWFNVLSPKIHVNDSFWYKIDIKIIFSSCKFLTRLFFLLNDVYVCFVIMGKGILHLKILFIHFFIFKAVGNDCNKILMWNIPEIRRRLKYLNRLWRHTIK